MLVPLSWLKEYVDITLTPEKLGERLTEVGLGTEKITKSNGDVIFEFEITSNRPDLLSIIGIAREIAAIEEKQIKFPGVIARHPEGVIGNNLPMEIKNNFSLCPRYTAIILSGVNVKPSPIWMQEKIKKVGLRPINNLVDITNYVMFETGNPLHVFDYDKINPKQLVMQTAAGGEKFTSVDEISYILPKGTIIIKDQPNRIIDLCGIKGGLNTGITDETKKVFLHVPVYIPTFIRRTSQALSLRSEASIIFERGASAGGTLETLTRAASLILDLAGGKIASQIIDLKKGNFQPRIITLRHDRLEKILGIKIKLTQVTKIFELLGFKTSLAGRPASPAGRQSPIYKVTIPTHRGDLKIEEDLIEEVARIHGYNNFPQTLPETEIPISPIPYLVDYSFQEKAKQILVGAGYDEILTYSLISQNTLKETGLEPNNIAKVANPVSAEFEYLRPTLIPNLLAAIVLNQPNFEKIKIFELGKVYLQKPKTTEEKWYLTGATTENYYSAKGVVKLICQELGIQEVDFKPWIRKDTLFQINQTAVIETPKAVLGTVGKIHHRILTQLSIKHQINIFELDFSQILKFVNLRKQYIPIPQYPPIIEDLSLVIQPRTPIGKLIQSIESTSSIIKSVQLLDSYKDVRTFRLVYQHPTRTLTNQEVGEIRKKTIKLAKEKFGVKIKND